MSDNSSPELPDTPDVPGSATVVQQGTPRVLGSTDTDSGATHTEALGGTERYELLEEIARGGMGIVFRARDRVFDREVGLKTLLQVPTEGSVIAARFLEEAHITGQLQHPNIPPVHDLGTLPDGRPYLAMKLIKGRTLDALLKTRIDPSHDRGAFIAIFEKIAEGVAYAHAHKVIHRDLKPLNVMVGAFGEVQVMDWGLAKVLTERPESTEVVAALDAAKSEIRATRGEFDRTSAGSILGTPAYMPREQAIGAVDQIDSRTDVFSLGGVLCVILTGKPPYLGGDAESTRQLAAIAKLDDCFARLDASGAEPELLALCKQCLAVERDERPRDAGEVAKAVANLRAESEKRARQAELDRAKAETQAAEQRKRRKVQLALAVAVLLLVCGGGAFAWWQDKQAVERKVQAQQAREGVSANLELATTLRKKYKFQEAKRALAQALKLAEGGAPERREEVEQAQRDLVFVVKLDDIRHHKWVWIPGEGEAGAFNTKMSSPAYRAAFAEHGFDVVTGDLIEAAKQFTASDAKDELVSALDDWALHEPDMKLRDRLLDVARRADPHPWTDRLRAPHVWSDPAAIQKLAEDADLVNTRPAALSTLATLMRLRGLNPRSLLARARIAHPAEFELAFNLAVWLSTHRDPRHIAEYGAARALRPENPSTLINMGIGLKNLGDLDGAVLLLEEATRLYPELTPAHMNLGNALHAKGEFAKAVAAHRRAIGLSPDSAAAHFNLGVSLSAMKDPKDIDAYRKAIELDPAHAAAHHNLANSLRDRRREVEAIAEYKLAVHHKPDFAVAHYSLGLALGDSGRPDEAIAEYCEAIRHNPQYHEAYGNLANLLRHKRDLPGAIRAYLEAIRCNPRFAASYQNLGNALLSQNDLDGAAVCYQFAVLHNSQMPLAQMNLGEIYRRRQQYELAELHARAAIKSRPRFANAHAVLGFTLRDKGDIDGARAELTIAMEIDKRFAGDLAALPWIAPPPREVKRP